MTTHYQASSSTWTITTTGTGISAVMPEVTLKPAQPPAPLSEVDRLLADVEAVCALAR